MMKTDQSQNNGNDSLETFFQKRLEDHNLQYNEAQWKKMDAMLDEARPKGFFWFTRQRLFWIWTGLITLLLINGTLFYFNTKIFVGTNPTQDQNKATTVQTPTVQPKNNTNQNVQEKSTQTNSLNQKKSETTTTKNNNSNNTQELNSQSNASSNIPKNDEPNAPASGKDTESQTTPVIPKINHNNNQPDHQGFVDNNKRTPIALDTTNNPEKNQLVTQADRRNKILLATLTPQQFVFSEANLTHQLPQELNRVIVTPNQVDSIKKGQTENILSNLPLVIGVTYSSDFSTTGLNNFTRPGNKWGGYLEYMLSSKFSLQAGAHFGKIYYETTGDEYQVPYKFWEKWTDGEVPETVDAVCDIVDISINARYYWLNKQRSRFFLNGGLSSYILTREVYNYSFDPSSQIDWNRWEVNNENKHILGVLNLSIGYEMALHPRVSFQIEPFLKVPLGEVGFGRVNLFSSGANFHLRYHIGKR